MKTVITINLVISDENTNLVSVADNNYKFFCEWIGEYEKPPFLVNLEEFPPSLCEIRKAFDRWRREKGLDMIPQLSFQKLLHRYCRENKYCLEYGKVYCPDRKKIEKVIFCYKK